MSVVWYKPSGMNSTLLVQTPWFKPGLYLVYTGVTT